MIRDGRLVEADGRAEVNIEADEQSEEDNLERNQLVRPMGREN